jgi:hypothetical protein
VITCFGFCCGGREHVLESLLLDDEHSVRALLQGGASSNERMGTSLALGKEAH